MNTNEIFAEQSAHVYEIQISRGDKMNALTDAMYGSLVEQLQYADSNDDIKVIFLRSDNKHFSAGNDLADFLEVEFSDESNVIQFLMTLSSLKKPIICAVGGAAVGIGVTMLLHCDLVYACDNTKFSVPFIKLGLTPEGGSSQLLAQRCGPAKANDWLLTGRTFFADEALNTGLVNHVCDDIESTWSSARKAAESLAKSPSKTLISTKALLKGEQVEDVINIMKKEAVIFAQALESKECKAAFNAFLKR
jgi:enoyl-CoA hydratase/carnithine racemase